jgi:hypothetical protein
MFMETKMLHDHGDAARMDVVEENEIGHSRRMPTLRLARADLKVGATKYRGSP